MSNRSRGVIRVFLSSPGDLEEERKVVARTIRNLNEEMDPEPGLSIELISSDTFLPDAGVPQDVINLQIPEYDVYLGILWGRFGTPTPRAGSGTEEEFRDALKKRTQHGHLPRILLYFCNRPVKFPDSEDDLQQLNRVFAFRKECEQKVFSKTYRSSRQFEEWVRKHLSQIRNERKKPAGEQSRKRRLLPTHAEARQLEDKMAQLLWISYAPVDFDPDQGLYPTEPSIERDLFALAQSPFGGIITFGSERTLASVPRIAREVGIQGVIMGVYDPCQADDIKAAVAAREYVDAYCIGHFGLRERRYGLAEIKDAIKVVRAETGRPVSTSETVEDLIAYRDLAETVDWIFPDVHHYWHEGTTPDDALDELREVHRSLLDLRRQWGGDRVALLKMISYPSGGGSGLTPEAQETFFSRLLLRLRHDAKAPARVYPSFFAAFDNSWKTPDRGWSAAELYTGLFQLDRAPKPAMKAFGRRAAGK